MSAIIEYSLIPSTDLKTYEPDRLDDFSCFFFFIKATLVLQNTSLVHHLQCDYY